MYRLPRTLLARAALATGALLVAVLARPALACSVCAAGDPLVQAGDAASDELELRLSLETEWLTASQGMEGMPGMTEELAQWSARVAAVAALLPRLNVVALVPIVRKDIRYHGGDTAMPGETFTGLGDVELGARWFILDRSNFEVMRHTSIALSGGTSLPTGENDLSDGGVRLDEHSQLGTGALSPYVGALFRLEQSRWHAFATVNGRVRMENGHAYRYGSSVGWSLQGQLQLHPRVAVGLALDGREAWPDVENGAEVPNTGGLVLNLTPAAHFGLGRGLWLQVRAQVPVATQLRGEQAVGPVVTAGVQLRVL